MSNFSFGIVITSAALIICGMIGALWYDAYKWGIEKTYCGQVTSRGYDPPSSGYKTSRPAVYWVVIKTTKQYVRVHVRPDFYYSKDTTACFTLSARDYRDYGN